MTDLKQRCEDMARRLEDLHKHGVISYTREAAALLRECAGDHRKSWNAAIEAAAKVADRMPNLAHPSEVVAAIRALKKGQTDD